MSNQTILRITREIAQIQQGSDLSIAVACQESDVRHLKALIIGPHGTPYEFGFFEFTVKFGMEYPSRPPKVEAKTTNAGRTRFNPNIYAGGKVCLSILGTWHGEKPGEEWSSAQGLESILWSIQSLMSNTPYGNEPGYENAKGRDDQKMNDLYCAKIRHETLRIAVIAKLEDALGIQADGSVATPEDSPKWSSDEEEEAGDEMNDEDVAEAQAKLKFEPFKDLYKRRFLWYFEHYMSTVLEHTPKHKDGSDFTKMPFEGGGNTMDGKFQYNALGKKLVRIKEVLRDETKSWAVEGLALKRRESSKAAGVQRQSEQLADYLKRKKHHNISVELENGNPYVWIMTYFGKPSTHLDGGIFKIKMNISPRFPDEQPRVKVETPIYHHRVSKDGVLCYFPSRPDELRNHVEAIAEALEEESPPYDPRTIVHPEATKLLWGSDDDKKKYYRQVRRSAQRTTEESV
ncbi:ubiquitin-conjugating enzyme E2 Z [Exophiala viscosa]|uniref:Ubiquitin-conjugating enzyme E2 Z n=1 Tax=Exophiala viscosa TaxID=2486360 RepID=A0AAN6DZI9_9EURO|nr:ubiquitin-conjugating enzyme E2 Z [Exophiala viscosa]